MPPVSLKNMADFDLVLDELWTVTRDEMNFLTEASNMEEFARRNKDVHFVGTPKLYQQYTTVHVLVMEYIDGCAVDDKERLKEEGYDLKEDVYKRQQPDMTPAYSPWRCLPLSEVLSLSLLSMFRRRRS